MDSQEAEQFRTALNGLLAGDSFVRSPALGRLLNHLVDRTIAGEAGSLKEAVIGHELYGRPAAYDPKLDSVVRVSANRLRLRLENHYRANPQEGGVVYAAGNEAAPRLDVFYMQTRTSHPLLTLGKLSAGSEISVGVLPDGHGVVFTASRTHSELSMLSRRR